uniref:Uncharacterized protein n=1 Tax=Branchiostoma floridae TaxID=7739 RepID=C3ZA85_BRAFL|eukprot:XP_002594467.1 hypothetical protein BRAFLDRAFT_87656 [Branchiostoma floridae]
MAWVVLRSCDRYETDAMSKTTDVEMCDLPVRNVTEISLRLSFQEKDDENNYFIPGYSTPFRGVREAVLSAGVPAGSVSALRVTGTEQPVNNNLNSSRGRDIGSPWG